MFGSNFKFVCLFAQFDRHVDLSVQPVDIWPVFSIFSVPTGYLAGENGSMLSDPPLERQSPNLTGLWASLATNVAVKVFEGV